MNEQNISFLAHESIVSRLERVNKRLWILCIILVIALVGTNAAWLIYEKQFEEVTVTQEVDATADGDSDINLHTIGGDYYERESEGTSNN